MFVDHVFTCSVTAWLWNYVVLLICFLPIL